MRTPPTVIALSAAVLALALAACSSPGGGTAGSAGGGSGSGGSSSGGGGGSSDTATFTGDLKGTVEMNLCTDSGVDSVFFLVAGDSTKYPGSIGTDELGFVGPDAKAWSLDKTGSAPVAVSGGSGGFTLDGVTVHTALAGSPTQTITVSGTLTCP